MDPNSVPPLQDATPSSATPTPKKEFQRSFKACDGCRLKKVKCDLGSLDAPSEPPCSRCKREMRQCLFTMSTRGRRPKARSARAHAFGAHHLAKSPVTTSRLAQLAEQDHDDDDDMGSPGDHLSHSNDSSSAIHALAGAALAALPDTNPRLHSTRDDVHVSALDPEDAPSIGMIYGLNRKRPTSSDTPPRPLRKHSRTAAYHDQSHKLQTSRHPSQPERGPDSSPSSPSSSAENDYPRPPKMNGEGSSSSNEDDVLQQYASVGLQNSRDALRVLAGVAVETRDSTASRESPNEQEDQQQQQPAQASGSQDDQEEDPLIVTSLDQQPRYRSNIGDQPVLTGSPPPVPPALAVEDPSTSYNLSRPITPPALKHLYGWSKFEPVRLKLIKRSHAKYFLNFFIRQMHSFAPHCSPHLLDRSPEALSELVCREPILLGAMLSVASRYDVANHNEHVSAPDTFHRKISKWTQEKISRSFFLPQSHTIGTIEALLILSEWATLDLHDRRASPDGSSESEDDGDQDDQDLGGDIAYSTPANTIDVAMAAVSPNNPQLALAGQPPSQATAPRRRSTAKAAHRVPKADMRESEKFDDTAWMLTGTALRLAERLDLHNDATYGGISSPNLASRRNAERRMRVWMSSVHADCHLSVRLGRRISSPGLTAPFMDLVRDRTHPFLIRSDASSSAGLSDTGFTTGSPRAWIAFRSHSELLQIVFRTCENLYRSKAVTERLLEDEDFVPALKSIRDDLDNWANWTQPRIEPIRDMTSLRLRVEYHYARLYANGIALDSVKRSLGTMRPQKQQQGRGRRQSLERSSSEAIGIGFSTHPAYPFVREALAAAQSLIRILTVELDSMMCAPARWFLLLVMAAVFCVKATAVSDTILPLKRCAQSLQQVISALTKAAPDGVHLANRYSMYLRQLAKQLVLTDASSRGGQTRGRSRQGRSDRRGSTRRSDHGTPAASSTAGSPQGVGMPSSSSNAPAPSPRTAAQLAPPPPQPVHTPMPILSAGTGSWWSTGDVLAGEVDPQTFLSWLDEQTRAAAPLAPIPQAPTPHTQAASNTQPPPSAAAAAAPANTTPAGVSDDLLTRMWLDDALSDLASSGLDMPFL